MYREYIYRELKRGSVYSVDCREIQSLCVRRERETERERVCV